MSSRVQLDALIAAYALLVDTLKENVAELTRDELLRVSMLADQTEGAMAARLRELHAQKKADA